jgi:hypothetical protein
MVCGLLKTGLCSVALLGVAACGSGASNPQAMRTVDTGGGMAGVGNEGVSGGTELGGNGGDVGTSGTGNVPPGSGGKSGAGGVSQKGGTGGKAGGANGGTPNGGMPSSISIAVVPQSARTNVGGMLYFASMVSGTNNAAVSWAIKEGMTGGTIDSNGTYTAPTSAGMYHVVVTSKADSNATATASVNVTNAKPCSDLPTAGSWEDITPTRQRGINGTIYNAQAFALDPFDSQTVWLGTALPNQTMDDQASGVYKSTDCGASWTKVDTGTSAADVDRSSLWSMAIDPVAQGTMYVVGAYGALGLFKSIDAGVNWTQLMTQGSDYASHVQGAFVGAVIMDPTNNLHLAVTAHGPCSDPYGSGGSSCQAESFDGGMNWNIVPNPDGLGFDENAGSMLFGMDNWLYTDPFASTYRTIDHGATWTKVGPGAQGAEQSHRPYVPASDGNYYLPSDHGIMVSKDQGASWDTIPNTPAGYGFAIGGGNMYICPEFSLAYHTAALSDLSTWTDLPNPPSRSDGRGSAFMEYDEEHHLLYSSNFEGGLFRMVTP